jgi:hypothetical protein
MSIALITGSAGLIGAEAVRFFSAKGMQVVGVDNDMELLSARRRHAWSRSPARSKLRRRRGIRGKTLLIQVGTGRTSPSLHTANPRTIGRRGTFTISPSTPGTLISPGAIRKRCSTPLSFHQHQQGLR